MQFLHSTISFLFFEKRFPLLLTLARKNLLNLEKRVCPVSLHFDWLPQTFFLHLDREKTGGINSHSSKGAVGIRPGGACFFCCSRGTKIKRTRACGTAKVPDRTPLCKKEREKMDLSVWYLMGAILVFFHAVRIRNG